EPAPHAVACDGAERRKYVGARHARRLRAAEERQVERQGSRRCRNVIAACQPETLPLPAQRGEGRGEGTEFSGAVRISHYKAGGSENFRPLIQAKIIMSIQPITENNYEETVQPRPPPFPAHVAGLRKLLLH